MLGKFEQALNKKRQQGRWHGAFENQSEIIEPNAGENRLSIASRADQGSQRRRAHVDHRGRLKAREDRGRRDRELNEHKAPHRRETERNRGIAN